MELPIQRVQPGTVSPAPQLEVIDKNLVLKNPKVELIYFGTRFWTSPQGQAIRARVDQAVARMGAGGLNNSLAEFEIGPMQYTGSGVFGFSGDRVGEGGIGEIVRQYRNAKLRSGERTDPETIYTVILRPGVELRDNEGGSSLQRMAGYHGARNSGLGPILYSAIVFDGPLGRNGLNFDGDPVHAITIVISHELAEAASDPWVSFDQLGIYDKKNNQEWADATINAKVLKECFDKNVYGDMVQKLWSPRLQDYVIDPGKPAATGSSRLVMAPNAAQAAMLLGLMMRPRQRL
jgi:hypothetical protein